MSTDILSVIEEEYDAFCLDRTRDMNKMYELLYEYLYNFIISKIKMNGFVDYDSAKELTQDVLVEIVAKGIHTFKKEDAKFTTYCTYIAKNKSIDYLRKKYRKQEESFEETEEEGGSFRSNDIYGSPEKSLMIQEHKLEQIELLKKYLTVLMNQKGKPYRITGCCYAMILFHKYNPNTKELSSPRWAFEEVHDSTVEESADRFEEEINQWLPRLGVFWGDEFLDAMEEEENGYLVADMVYEEHFKVKDFENWSLRMRKKIKDSVIRQELELLN